MLVQLGDLYALGGAATFAISSAIIKRLNIIGNASQLNFLRTIIGALLFLLQLMIVGQVQELFHIKGLVLVYLALSVIFNVVLGDTAFFESQNKLGVKIATPIVNTFPYFTIIFAVLLLGEQVSTSLILGSFLLIPGVILLSLDEIEDKRTYLEDSTEVSDDSHSHREKIIGLLLVLFAIACYTAGIIYTTIATKGLTPVVANSIRLPVGALGLFGLVTIIDRQPSQKEKTTTGWPNFIQSIRQSTWQEKILIVIAGVFGTYLSSLFLVLSVQAIGASRSAILFSTGPFFSLPLAVLWLKEHVGWKTLLGTIMTIIGLWIILV